MLNFSSGCNSPSEQLEIHTLLPVTDLGSLVQKSSARHIPNFGWGSVPPLEQLDIRTTTFDRFGKSYTGSMNFH